MSPGYLASALQRRFGALHQVCVKPLSAHYQNADRSVLIKVYRVIEPAARMRREVEALLTARRLDVRVPTLIGYGVRGNAAWTAVAIVPGEPMHLRTSTDVETFARAAREALAPLHTARLTSGAAPGWSGPEAPKVSTHLAAQVRMRFRALPAWPCLLTAFLGLDGLPVVRLHGDVKPDHLLAVPTGSVTVVDWEAAHRGPVILDEVDVVFRILREIVYGDLSLSEDTLASLPWTEAHAAAMAWRLGLWIDRRHHNLTEPVITLVDRVAQLASSVEAVCSVVTIMRQARAIGIDY